MSIPAPWATWVVNDETAAPPQARIVEDWQMADPKNPKPRAKSAATKKNPSSPDLAGSLYELMYDVLPFLSGAAIGWLDGRFADKNDPHAVGKHWAKLSIKKRIFGLSVLAAGLWWWASRAKAKGDEKLFEHMSAARHGVSCLIGRYIGQSMGEKAAAKKNTAPAPPADAPTDPQGANQGVGAMSWEDYDRVNDMVHRQVRQVMDEFERRRAAGQSVAGLNVRQLPGMHDTTFGSEFAIDPETVRALAHIRVPGDLRSAA